MRGLRRFAGVFLVMVSVVQLLAGTSLWNDAPRWGQGLLAGLAGGCGAVGVIVFEGADRAGGRLRHLAAFPVLLLTIGAAMQTSWYRAAESFGERVLPVACGAFIGGVACSLLGSHALLRAASRN